MSSYKFVISPRYQVAAWAVDGTLYAKTLYVSEDGLNWSPLVRNTSFLDQNNNEIAFRSLKYAGDFWFGTLATIPAVGGYTRQTMYSVDLVNWFQSRAEAAFFEFNKYVVAGNRIHTFEPNDNTLTSFGPFVSAIQSADTNQNGIVGYSYGFGTNSTEYYSFIDANKNVFGNDPGWGASGTSFVQGVTRYSYSLNAWAVTREADSGNEYFAITFDLGTTWDLQNPLGGSISDLAVMPDGSFVVVGRDINGDNVIGYTSDGFTWNIEASPIPSSFGNVKVEIVERPITGTTVIIIHPEFFDGLNQMYGNSSLGQGNPWTQINVGAPVDPTDPTYPRLQNQAFTNNYPIPSNNPYITVGADVPVYTVDQETLIQATLRYEAPVQTGQDNLMLYKVAKDYRWSKTGEVFPAMPQTDEGRPFYENIFDPDDPTQTTFTTQPGILPYRYEIVEPWGKIAIFINGQDVSYFRDAATVIESISWQTLGNFEAASFYLPQISQYDKLGETIPTLTSGTGGGILPNAIEWLTDDAPIEIKRIRPDDTLETIWLGTVNGLDLDPSGMGMRITAHGLLYEANHQLLPGQFQQPKFIPSRDTGLLAAEVLNSIDGRWSYTQPEETGVLTKKSPNWDNALDFLRNLNAIGSPEIWIDTDYKAYVTGRPDLSNDRRVSTFDIINGQDGVECSLQYDSNAAPTVIYGTGRTPGGARWRNVVYPAVENLIFYARYPFDFPEQHLSKGMSNTDTVGGFGVSGLWARLSVKGFLPSTVGFTTYFNDTIEAAVKIAQETYGLDINGEVDDVLWSRLFDVADIFDGAYIAPLYTSPLIDPSSPSFDPTVRRVEQFIDFGENMFPSEAIDVAEKIIERDMIQYNTTGTPIYKQRKSVTGTIAMSMDPIEYVLGGDVSRWDLKPGDSIRLLPHIFAPIQDDKHDAESGTFWESGDSGGSLLLYIKRIEWSFGDTPKAILTVSTRNLEFNELDAAQARVKVSNAERAIDQKAKKASGKTASS